MKKKINIIIVEKDDMMFDRLRQDLKLYSPYINKIYRSSYHEDIYKINDWEKCKLIIAHNPENIGLNFFKSFYLNPLTKEYKIFGFIYTRNTEKEIQFYRITRFLYEWSDRLFLGIIYKSYGSLEKILEIIRNATNNWRCYPIIDWMQKEEKPAVLNPARLILLRKLHNLKYEILSSLRPLIITLTEFYDTKKETTLRKNIKANELYFNNITTTWSNFQEHIQDFLQFEFKGKKLDSNGIKTEIYYHTKKIKKFAYDINVFPVNYANISYDKILFKYIVEKKDGYLERFLKEYDEFIKSLNKIINLLDKQYFIK